MSINMQKLPKKRFTLSKFTLSLPNAPKGFTLIELLVVISIIGVLSVIGLNSFGSARVKSRDSNRKSDLSAISKALELYYNDLGEYPDHDNGSIVGCGDSTTPATCTWGDTFQNPTTGEVYMITLPDDSNSTYDYYYESFTVSGINTSYQLYARLENTRDIAVGKDVDDAPQVYGTLLCGTLGCNYGVSSSNITLEDNSHDLVTEEE